MSSLIFFAPGAECPSSPVARRRASPPPLPSSDIAPGATSTADSRFTPRVLITSTCARRKIGGASEQKVGYCESREASRKTLKPGKLISEIAKKLTRRGLSVPLCPRGQLLSPAQTVDGKLGRVSPTTPTDPPSRLTSRIATQPYQACVALLFLADSPTWQPPHPRSSDPPPGPSRPFPTRSRRAASGWSRLGPTMT